MTTTKKPKATKKAPAKKATPAKKAPAKKSAPKPKEPTPDAKEPEQAPVFREIRNWQDCKDQKILLAHQMLSIDGGYGPEKMYHRAKVLQVDLTAGTILVFVATEEIKGRYLLPIDGAAAKVK